ncbi:MAG TPA: hypothetical protein PKK69_06345, partial [Ferruginibacter sp.]|nr:hypothetical protein [Ferruginibacter sp.]
MLKRSVFLIGSLLCLLSLQAQPVTSPEVYLGYQPGTHFTPHHRILGYVKTLASEAPTRMQLKPYGKTNEGN